MLVVTCTGSLGRNGHQQTVQGRLQHNDTDIYSPMASKCTSPHKQQHLTTSVFHNFMFSPSSHSTTSVSINITTPTATLHYFSVPQLHTFTQYTHTHYFCKHKVKHHHTDQQPHSTTSVFHNFTLSPSSHTHTTSASIKLNITTLTNSNTPLLQCSTTSHFHPVHTHTLLLQA